MTRRNEVFIVLPGGIEARGGIGQAVRNLTETWKSIPDAPSWRVLDSWSVEWRLKISVASFGSFISSIITIFTHGRSGQLKLLHLNMADRGSMVRKGILVWLGRLVGVPTIVHVHASSMLDRSDRLPRPLRTLLRATLERACVVVVLGAYWRAHFVEHIGLAPEHVVVIPYGVPTPAERQPRPQDTCCRLLFLGRLGKRKGTPEILEALAHARVAGLKWKARFAGDGAIEEMRALAERLGVGGRCTFLGWVDRAQADALLAESDVLMLPSHREGLPLAILEAMAHGLAVVSTRAGAIEDAIVDGEIGLLVPIDDASALADAIHRLLVDQELRHRLQQAARERHLRDYRVALFAERIRNVYRRCGLP